jgi:hypothetical protein
MTIATSPSQRIVSGCSVVETWHFFLPGHGKVVTGKLL